MGLRWLSLCVVCVAFGSGCARCGTPAVDSNLTLTEKDTWAPPQRLVHAPDGGVWTLTMPDAEWRVVHDAARVKVHPEADVWALNPSRAAHVTVQCAPGRTIAELEPALKVAAERAGRTYTALSRTEREGAWVRGVELAFSTSTSKAHWTHVEGLFELARQTCDVQAWATDDVQRPVLERVVQSFQPLAPPSERALLAPLKALGSDVVKARVAELLDAGTPMQLVPVALVERGLGRLSDEAIERRFALRQRMLKSVDDATCGAIVAHSDDQGLLVTTLDTLSADDAADWGRLSAEAMQAEAERREPPPRDRQALAEAQRAWLARDGVRAAEELMTRGNQTPPPALCQAERTRLSAAFALEPAVRALLFRAWLDAP